MSGRVSVRNENLALAQRKEELAAVVIFAAIRHGQKTTHCNPRARMHTHESGVKQSYLRV